MFSLMGYKYNIMILHMEFLIYQQLTKESGINAFYLLINKKDISFVNLFLESIMKELKNVFIYMNIANNVVIQ